MNMRDRLRAVQQLSQNPALAAGGRLSKIKKGTGKRLTADERNKLRKAREKEMRRKKRDQRKNK
jgi:signal recognition particle subunit SRP54